MSNNESQMDKNRPSAKSSVSSNNLITAWQIQSTLSTMEQFMRFIQGFQTQRQKSRAILPFVGRIKKIEEQKQSLQSLSQDLFRKQNEKGQNIKKSQNQQTKNKVIMNKQSQHETRLRQIVVNLKKQNSQNGQKLSRIRKIMVDQQKKAVQIRGDLRSSIINKFDKVTFQETNQMTNKICRQQSQLKGESQQTLLNLLSTQLSKPTQNKINPNSPQQQPQRNTSTTRFKTQYQNITSQQYSQLGEIKCKLLSLQDKKRKITVKNLLNSELTTGQQHLTEDQGNMRLRLTQITSQMLQLQEQINISTNQNIFTELFSCAVKYKQVNQQVLRLVQQIFQVFSVLRNRGLSPSLNGIRLQSSQKRGKQRVPKPGLKQNQNIRFFLNLIKEKLSQRYDLVKRLFFNIKYSIQVFIRYVRKKLRQIKQSYQLTVSMPQVKSQIRRMSIEKKQKVHQALKIHLKAVSSKLKELIQQCQYLIQEKLQPFLCLFQNQLINFHTGLITMYQKNQLQHNEPLIINNRVEQSQFLNYQQLEYRCFQHVLFGEQDKIGKKNQSQGEKVFEKYHDKLKQQVKVYVFGFHEQFIITIFALFSSNF